MTDRRGKDRELGEARTELGVGPAATPAPQAETVEERGDSADSDHARTKNLTGKPRLEVPEVPGYRILQVLGEGGMGTVYAAQQESPRRKVAIKMLHRGSQGAWLRFQTEAQAMARFDHPGIARVLEAGEADGHPFLVMDFVDGATLDQHVKDVPLRARLELFVAMCDAVHHAHVKGVIHRDLKPSNVMVRDGKRVVVLDFGVARLADDNTPGPTRAGELIGTPLYMSPEQARLRPDEVDARTDVYTLGVMLYELACNELPYEAPRGIPLPVLTVMICDEPPVLLGKRDPALRGDLEAITMKALAKDPGERYQSVAALADDVRRYLDGRPVSVRMPGALERAQRFVRRRPLAAVALAGSVLAVVTFAAVVTALWLDARDARRVAEDASARREAARAALETRTNELILRQARAALARDPTEALGWLATLGTRDVDARIAAMIADEAVARGVARDVMRNHADEVHWVQPISGGLVSGGYDGRVIVWDPAPRVVFTSDKGRVHVAQPSPDGTRIAIGGDGGTLVVVSRDGIAREALGQLQGDVDHVEWSSDGKLAASSDRGDVWVFDQGRGPGRELHPSGPAIGGLAFSTPGTELIAGDDIGTLRVWSLATNAVATETGNAPVVGVFGDGSAVVAVEAEGRVRRRGFASAKLTVASDFEIGKKLKRVVFADDGSEILVGGVGGEVMRVRGATVETLGTHQAQVRSLALSRDGQWSASGGDDGSLVVRSHAIGRQLALRGHTGRIRHVAFAGSTLYSGDSDGVIRRWDLAQLGTNVLATAGSPAARVIVHDGRVVAIDEDGRIHSWTLATGVRTDLDRIAGRVTALAAAGPLVVAGTSDGLVQWTLPGERQSKSLRSTVEAIAVHGERVAVAIADGPIEIFDRTARPLATLSGHAQGTDALAFDSTGNLLASGGQDRVIRVWRARDATFVEAAALDGPTGDTHFVAFTPANDRLIAAGNDGAVLTWQVKDGTIDASSRTVIAQHTGAITALAVTDDVIASAGRDLALIRTPRTGASDRTTLPAAALSIAIGGDTLFASTRAGSVVRWKPGSEPVVEIDHGVRVTAPIKGESRWVLAFDDGAIVIATLAASTLAELQARIPALTSHRLPPR